jgi:glycosyltransferase involved in cell wall biosynthesis
LEQPRVSIITPMYNEATYVAECIDSVLNQTYQNWEYIIVDNCSTDLSAKIARTYAERDERIRVVRNSTFLEAVENFNAALRQMTPESKYCKVVFADDQIFPECVEQMVGVAEAHPSVGLVGAYGIEGSRVAWTGLPYPGAVISGREVCRRLFLDGLYVFGTATSLLYRADLVRSHDPFFDASDVHSDRETCIVLLKDCDFGFVHQVLTMTRVREESLFALSRTVNTFSASDLNQLVLHGRDFLSPEEFARCLDRSVSEYYWFLAGSLVRGRDKAFWAYHKRALVAAGVGFSRSRLARTLIARICVAVLHPRDSIQRLSRPRSGGIS